MYKRQVTLGVKSKMVRLALILLSLLLVAFATSVTGPIASVAFLAGPIATRLCGGGRTNMLASALVGSVLVLASDLIGQFAVSYTHLDVYKRQILKFLRSM